MKIFFAEALHHYQVYYFPYQVLLLREKGDSLSKIYSWGFLPFRNRENLFYLTRSSRSDLRNFSLSSENRRIIKKTESITTRLVPLSEFHYTPEVQRNCKHWARERGWRISTTSLKFIFSGKFFNFVLLFQHKGSGEVVGYQILVVEDDFWHAAHVFYHPDYVGASLGTRMLLEACILTQKKGARYCYLGTCYGKGGFYKRNLPGFEFFNGFGWSRDIEELKYLNERDQDDYLLREKEYLERFSSGKIEKILEEKGVPIKLGD